MDQSKNSMAAAVLAVTLGLVSICRSQDAKPDSPAVEPVSTDADWASIEIAGSYEVGKPFDITVNVKDVPPDSKLAVDLYWLKSNGMFGGLLLYGPRKAATADKTETFHYTIKPKEGMGQIYATAFISPDGKWESKVKTVTSPKVSAAGDAAPKAAKKPAPKKAGKPAKADGAKAAAKPEAPPKFPVPAGVTFKKSWISVVPPEGVYHEGDTFHVKVNYYLDPSESWGDGTKLGMDLHGPWVDSPDGVYSKTRMHNDYPGRSVVMA